MRLKISTLCFFVCFAGPFLQNGLPSTVSVQGSQLSYAGESLVFYTHADPFVTGKRVLGTALADSSGTFFLSFRLDRTSMIQFSAGAYLLCFYAEPGGEYFLQLPEKREKQPEDFLNPYFQPEWIQLEISGESPSGLNALIASFDMAYYPVYNELAVQVYGGRTVPGLDTAIADLQDGFPDSPEFFSAYKRYRIEQLRLLLQKPGAITKGKVDFPDAPPEFNNPAYTDLFMKTFSHVLRYPGREENSVSLNRMILARPSPAMAIPVLSKGLALTNERLLEAVLLKGVFDAYYAGELPAGPTIALLDTLILSGRNSETQAFASIIRQHITRLMPGYPAPDFSLPDTDGKILTLQAFRGRYVYLSFCSANSYTCQRDARILVPLSERYTESLLLVMVMVGRDTESPGEFISGKPGNWIFLEAGEGEDVFDIYRVRAYPTYYLIDPEGKLLLSPAPGPAERFEEHLLRMMKK